MEPHNNNEAKPSPDSQEQAATESPQKPHSEDALTAKETPLQESPSTAPTEQQLARAPEALQDRPLSSRERWVVQELQAYNQNLREADRNAKYAKMGVSPYAFFRGTNHLYWADFAGDTRLHLFGNSSTRIWIQGDMHVYNFGVFDDSEGDVVYGMDDFDEAIIADYQYDLWRLAISLLLVARENNQLPSGKDLPFSTQDQEQFVTLLAQSYREALMGYVGNDDEVQKRFTSDSTSGRLDDLLEDTEDSKSRQAMLDKWTKTVQGARVLKEPTDYDDAPKLSLVSESLETTIRNAMSDYGKTLSGTLQWDPNYFAVKSIRKRENAGTGSLGLPRYYILIEGASTDPSDDRILDVKLQSAPSSYPYLPASWRAQLNALFPNHAARTVMGYRSLGHNTDPHLGWMTLPQGVFSVRERSPFKKDFNTQVLKTRNRFEKMVKQWGLILATHHARADNDSNPTVLPYSFEQEFTRLTDKSPTSFVALVLQIATSYADQVEKDYQAFQQRLLPS